MSVKYLINMSSPNYHFKDTYSIADKSWFSSSVVTLNWVAIPSRFHKDEALLLLSLGLGKQEIEEHFNIGK